MANTKSLNNKHPNHIAAKKLLKALKEQGAYLYHVSNYDSIYIRFKNKVLRSIRIGDHSGRKKYRYKWNLCSDRATSTQVEGNVIRYYYHFDDLGKLVLHIQNYSQCVQYEAWE